MLTDARRANPASSEVLGALARLYLSQQQWLEAEEVANALAALPQPQAQTAAQEIRGAILLGQNRVDEGLSFLSGLVDDKTEGGGGGTDDNRAVAMILEAQVREGRTAEARAYLDGILAQRPDDPTLKLMSAGSIPHRTRRTRRGDLPRDDRRPRQRGAGAPAVCHADRAGPRGRCRGGAGRGDGGAAAVGHAALDEGGGVGTRGRHRRRHRHLRGDVCRGQLERGHRQQPCLADHHHRTDPASLERAYAVARRLRGLDVPAFQDTYGWIAFRRGEIDEALAHLEPAAAGLPDERWVQYHLGMAYAGAGRTDDARKQLERALELAGPDSTLPQMAEAKKKLDELNSTPSTGTAAPATAPARPLLRPSLNHAARLWRRRTGGAPETGALLLFLSESPICGLFLRLGVRPGVAVRGRSGRR